MSEILSWFVARLSEPSSWAGIGLITTAIKTAVSQATTGQYLLAVGSAAAGVVAFCKAEGGSSSS